jgi:hypothetical protein
VSVFNRKEPKLDTSKAGGWSFFLSLGAAIIFAPMLVVALLTRFDAVAFGRLLPFATAVGGGALLATFIIRGHIAVFIHELKHSIVANLVGNKARNFRIRKETGHFEYEFTEKTRKYNAFISLAPYWLPLFTLAGGAIGYAGWWSNHAVVALIVGVGWGIDLALIARDIGPHQTDFSNLRGGYRVGLTYVAALNTCVGALLFAWASGGPAEILAILRGIVTSLYSLTRSNHLS